MYKLKILVLIIFLLVTISFAISCSIKEKDSIVKLYYYNPELDKDNEGNILCSEKGLVPVERKIKSKNLIEDTIKLLIEGKLTEEEKRIGITTEFPLEGFKLLKSELINGVLTLTFDDPYNKTSGGACRSKILWIQIEYTAKQFKDVKEVKFMPEGLFQP
jgi:spore germination protein GerM